VIQTVAQGPHAARERFPYTVYYTKSYIHCVSHRVLASGTSL